MMDGRWDVFVCTGCGECTGRHAACDAVREKTPVVPCDDAAIERGIDALEASDNDYRYVTRADMRATVESIVAALAGRSTHRTEETG